MSHNVLFFAWKRSVTGRENLSSQHFQDFSEYLGAQKGKGAIESFEPVLLEPNGSPVIGFFLIRGNSEQLNKLTASTEWVQHITRAMLHLEEPVLARGMIGNALTERLGMWTKAIPKS